jgi:hypothetical protein
LDVMPSAAQSAGTIGLAQGFNLILRRSENFASTIGGRKICGSARSLTPTFGVRKPKCRCHPSIGDVLTFEDFFADAVLPVDVGYGNFPQATDTAQKCPIAFQS